MRTDTLVYATTIASAIKKEGEVPGANTGPTSGPWLGVFRLPRPI
jgi:hypothetical protein